MAEASDGNIIPPTNNITAMKYGMMLSHVDESGDALMCCGVCWWSGEELIKPRQQMTHVIDTAITTTSGAIILKISRAGTPSNLKKNKN